MGLLILFKKRGKNRESERFLLFSYLFLAVRIVHSKTYMELEKSFDTIDTCLTDSFRAESRVSILISCTDNKVT